MPAMSDEMVRALKALAAARVTEQSRWLDEGIAALIRAGVPPERIAVEYWPDGRDGYATQAFARVVVKDPE